MPGLTNSALVRGKLAFVSGSLNEAYRRFWAEPDLARLYPAYLVQLHQIVRASVPLMEAARRRSSELSGADPVGAPLAAYFEEHIAEERDHDQWLLNDLAAIGIPREEALRRAPSPRVATFVGAQYYWVLHHHPIALLGYIALVEEPPPLALIDEIERRSGLPEAAFRTIRDHARIDPGHAGDLDRFLDALPLSAAHHEALGLSLIHSASALEGCVEELMRAAARA